MTGTLTYLFCLVRSHRRPVPPDGPSALPPVRVLDVGGGLWAVVTDVPASDFSEAALARGLPHLEWVGPRAMAHEAVVEHFLAARAVLPMQMFSLFTSEARAVDHVRRDRRRIDRILLRIERQFEWGLRLTFDVKGARAAVAARHARMEAAGASTTRAGRRVVTPSGSAYLARKRDLLDVTGTELADARIAADALYHAMAGEASAARRRTSTEEAAPGSRLLLDAAFLVPVRRAAGFRAALRRNARKLGASGVVIALTGPWPAYNFIDEPAARTPTPAATPRRPPRKAR